MTLLRCKTCAIDIGSLKATYLLTYLCRCSILKTAKSNVDDCDHNHVLTFDAG